MHKTPTGEKIKKLHNEARRACKDVKSLESIRPGSTLAEEKKAEHKKLKKEAAKLRPLARLEDLSVYQVKRRRKLKSGQIGEYAYWYASWISRDGRTRNVYLGSVRDVSEKAALTKARITKARDLMISL